MQRTIALISFLLIFGCQNTPEISCNNFREGKFTYKNEKYDHVLVTRDLNIQTEYDSLENKLRKFKIVWQSDCEYNLIPLKGSMAKRKLDTFPMMNVYIVDVRGNEYDYI